MSQSRLSRRPVALLLFLAALTFVPAASGGPLNTVTVDVQQVMNPRAPLLLGMSFDARASFYNPQDTLRQLGYYHRHTGAPLPIAAQWEAEWPQTSLRYPQGPINTWEWKKTVGPIAQRPIITSHWQKAAFGLQEFLDMTERTGLDPADITMMVNIWGPGGFASPNTPLAVQDAADLVAYLNKPWDGQPFNGANYEALRAQSHVAPYGVKYFNLGNEPWGSAEWNFKTTGDPNPANDGAVKYATLAQQFITAMRSVDSSLSIALAGPSVSLNPAPLAQALAWNDTLMRRLGGQFQLVSTNMYYEFEPGEMTLRGVQKVGDALNLVSARIANYNALHGTSIRQVIGEHGNALDFDYTVIPTLQLDVVDFNMCYQGAVTTADFLMMTSNMPGLERIHHFIWGNANAVWRPIRSTLNGTQTVFTVLPPAELYRALGSRVLDHSVSATTSSVGASDGETYAVRGGAFRSNDGSRLNVILVNRDPAIDQTVDVLGTSGHVLTAATIMSGDSAQGFTTDFAVFPVSPSQGRFEVPRLSVLMLEYQAGTLDVAPDAAALAPAFAGAFPNPSAGATTLRYSLPSGAQVTLRVFDVMGRKVRTLRDGPEPPGLQSATWDGRDDSGVRVGSGMYLTRLEAGGAVLARRLVVLD